jgi:putative flippase GtrA
MSKAHALRALRSRQFLVFIAGGVLSAIVDIGTMMLLVRSGFPLFVATSGGFALGLAVNYLYHARLTFDVSPRTASVARYLAIVGANYGLTLLFVFVAQALLGNALLGKVASLPAVAVNGFLLSKFWAFR